jgi:type II secretory pathway pseudopilin PulG
MRYSGPARRLSAGFTLVEALVAVLLLALAMLGILAVLDVGARISKNEQDVADAQGAVRYGVFQMTRAIRMAGSGGLFVTQAVLNHRDPQLPGITVANSADVDSYDNVEDGTKITPLSGSAIRVRPGTDMIEVRGVLNSPMLGFDLGSGCQPCDPAQGCAACVGTVAVRAPASTNLAHINHDPASRPQFSQLDAYTAGVSASNPMFVLVAFHDDVHAGCGQWIGSQLYPLYPQPPYNVGAITSPTTLVSGGTFGSVNFADSNAVEFNSEMPADPGVPAQARNNLRHAGILDDLVFFIDNSDPLHPALAQGSRRGGAFDVVALADDVEDMQIAYGVDLDGNNSIDRLIAPSAADPETNVSYQAGGDEWVPNAPAADNPVTRDSRPFTANNFVEPVNRCPRLHAVMISIVARSHDPDPAYKAPSALGLVTLNSPVTIHPPHPDTAQYPGSGVATFRRRVQTLKINLRNYTYEGLAPSAVPAP